MPLTILAGMTQAEMLLVGLLGGVLLLLLWLLLRSFGAERAMQTRLADALADQVRGLPGAGLMFPVQANAVFLKASDEHLDALRARGWRFYTFIGGGARFMFSWDADLRRVDELARDLRAVFNLAA